MSKEEEVRRKSKNNIDPDKVAENPGLLPYAHHIGSAIIKPLDKGRVKGNAMSAMYQQTDTSLHRIKEQVEVLIKQAQEIHDRINVSEKIYEAHYGFEPIIGQMHYLYRRKNDKYVMSIVSPADWGNKPPYEYIATVELLADHTWKIHEMEQELDL